MTTMRLFPPNTFLSQNTSRRIFVLFLCLAFSRVGFCFAIPLTLNENQIEGLTLATTPFELSIDKIIYQVESIKITLRKHRSKLLFTGNTLGGNTSIENTSIENSREENTIERNNSSDKSLEAFELEVEGNLNFDTATNKFTVSNISFPDSNKNGNAAVRKEILQDSSTLLNDGIDQLQLPLNRQNIKSFIIGDGFIEFALRF